MLSETIQTEVYWDRLILKSTEYLYWTHTWTAHFADGEFFQTEAISDTVRLAPNAPGQYFTTGTYTSTVFDAGRQIDWLSANWNYSNTISSIALEYRTGNTLNPDPDWSTWASVTQSPADHVCNYVINTNWSECMSNMGGIQSSQFIQYRASFVSTDPSSSIALYDIELMYGIHPATGTAVSLPLAQIDLKAWENVIYSSTVPISTSLVIDVLALDGGILIANAINGDSLESIDPNLYPGIKLRATFTTNDPSLTPVLDLWGVRWSVSPKVFLPVVLR